MADGNGPASRDARAYPRPTGSPGGRLGPEETAALFEQLAKGGRDEAEARETLIASYIPLVVYLARRFEKRGEPFEDLVQVGTIGLIKAVDRYEAGRGDFLAYATPTIVGEIKRYFRDTGAAVRVPRRLREVQAATAAAVAVMSQELGRYPTVAEVAARLSLEENEVLEAIESSQAQLTTPIVTTLDEPSQGIPSEVAVDPAQQALERRLQMDPLLKSLPFRDRSVIVLRFYGNMTQTEIAAQLGISQMHVSRVLTRALERLKTQIEIQGADS